MAHSLSPEIGQPLTHSVTHDSATAGTEAVRGPPLSAVRSVRPTHSFRPSATEAAAADVGEPGLPAWLPAPTALTGIILLLPQSVGHWLSG